MAKLNEISKKTLGSYIKKAGNDMAVNHAEVEKARSDYDSIAAIDHLARGTPSNVRDKAEDIIRNDALGRQKKHFKKVINRKIGIRTAVNKLTKEALDYANNRDFLGFREYITEALNARVANIFEGPEDEDELDFDFNLDDIEDLEDLPESFLGYVAENISEEDFEQLDEISKKTLGSYRKEGAE